MSCSKSVVALEPYRTTRLPVVNFIDLHVQPDSNISHYMYSENFECVMQDLYLN